MYFLQKTTYIGLLISYCISLISIPFKSINFNNDNSNFFNKAISTEIYINLTLSNYSKKSNKEIKTLINIDKSGFYLPQKYLSASKKNNEDRWLYVSWANTLLYFSNDSFSINILKDESNNKTFIKKISYNNILNFLTKNEIETNEIYNNYGIIGLKLISNENEENYPNFLNELKRDNLTSKYIWHIKYNYITPNYFEGELLIGEDVDKYLKKEIYEYEEIRTIKAYNRNNELYWDIKFKDILIGGKSINIISNNKFALQATFEPKLNLIIGTTEFKNAIMNQFFNNYIYKRICYEEKILFNNLDYIGITCKKPFNVSEFPIISFKLQFYIFHLNYENLFYEDIYKKDIYHFLIIFHNDYYSYENNELWIFGVPFLNKYIFIFDSDSKLIMYYSKNTNNLDSKEEVKEEQKEDGKGKDDFYKNKENNQTNNNIINKKFNKGLLLIIIGIIIGSGLLILFGMKIQKIVLKKRFPNLNLNGRKRHKNELSCELEQMNKDDNLLVSN